MNYKKIIKFSLLTILFLLISLLILLYWILNTESGLRALPKIANKFSPVVIQADKIEGKILGKNSWKNLKVSLHQKEIFSTENLVLDLSSTAIFAKKINIKQLRLDNSLLTLPPSKDKKEKKKSGYPQLPQKLPEINIPLAINAQNLEIKNFKIDAILHIENFTGSAVVNQSNIALQTNTNINLLSDNINTGNISAELAVKTELKGEYPLEIQGKSTVKLIGEKPQTQNAEISANGSLLNPEIKITTNGDFADSIVTLAGNIDNKNQSIDLSLDVGKTSILHDEITVPAANISLKGKLNAIAAALSAEVSGKKIPDIKTLLNAEITRDEIRNIKLDINTLGGKITADGNLQLQEKLLAWQANLSAEKLDGNKYAKKIPALKDFQLDGNFSTTGELAEKININLALNQIKGKWQNLLLNADGKILLNDKNIQAEQVNLDIAGNRLVADGNFSLENQASSALKVDIDAQNLHKIVPILHGKFLGNINLAGNLSAPQLDGEIAWNNFKIDKIVELPQGKITAQGTLEELLAKINTTAIWQKEKFNLDADIVANSKEVKKLSLIVKGFGGNAKIDGQAKFNPNIEWKTDITGANLDLSRLVGFPAKISTIVAENSGKMVNNKPEINALIKQVEGNWQGQKLSLTADSTIDGANIDIKAIALQLGQANSLNAKGKIKDTGDIDIEAKSSIENLSLFYRPLKGSVKGNISAKGKMTNPNIKSDLSIRNLKIFDNAIDRISIKLDTALSGNSNFNNQIIAENISASGKKWQEIKLITAGTFKNHSIKINTKGGEINTDISAQGGFSALPNWNGNIGNFSLRALDNELKLRGSAPLKISDKNITLSNFCLTDKHSNFCLDLAKSNAITLKANIEKIVPQSFAAFLPKNMRVETAMSGKAEIKIDEKGTVAGGGDLRLQPGKIVIPIAGKPPLVLNIKQALLETRARGSELQNRLNLDLGDAGVLSALAGINLSKNTLDAKADFELKDIGKFKYFLPQISVLQGKINGKLRAAGALSKPTIGGDITLANGKVIIPEYATDLRDIRLNVQSRNDGTFGITGNIGTPKGALKATGNLQLIPLVLNLNLNGERMQLANSKTMKLTASPKFAIKINPENGVDINGEIHIPEAAISIPDTRGSVSKSEDVVIKRKSNTANSAPTKSQNTAENVASSANNSTKIRIKISLGNKVFFKNSDMNIRLIGALNILLRNSRLFANGRIEVANGTYEIYGQELQIKRGSATFSGNIANPSLDILALREIGDISAGAKISGTVKNMKLELTSEPPMPDASILSYLLTGHSLDAGTDSTSLLQTAASIGTRGIFPDDLANKTGLDVFELGVTGLKAGKNLGEDIYVGMKSDFFTSITTFLARYQINSRLSLEGSSSQKDGSAIDLLYEFEK
ncbi:MAG: translocation/assembly module TamB domain-containing protein [Cardiobacteriaceae bacterium]|nr:translocation/assembly module TamB domain-containing protein [Cardiobacteriaceae bacterium]